MAPWRVECDMSFLPAPLQSSEAVGKSFDVTLKLDLEEVERLGQLDEPLVMEHTIRLRVLGAPSSAPFSDAEAKRRYRLTSTKHEIFLGIFEVTDSAVNEALVQMRNAAVEAPGQSAKEILAALDEQVETQGLVEEVARQHEALLRATPLGLDLSLGACFGSSPTSCSAYDEAVPRTSRGSSGWSTSCAQRCGRRRRSCSRQRASSRRTRQAQAVTSRAKPNRSSRRVAHACCCEGQPAQPRPSVAWACS